jgi:tRNA pseudouridine55 synthase
MYSAVKQGGEKLYEKARRGEEVEREPRQVAIYRLSIEVYDYPHLTLTVRCSPGTYIRSLAHDLGQSLGCGAYLGGLRRTSSGENFTAENALPLDQLERDIAAGDWLQHVVNVRAGLSQMPYIELNNQQERVIRNGGSIQLGISNRGLIQGWTDEGLFVGILKRNGEDDATANWKAEKVFNLETDEQE